MNISIQDEIKLKFRNGAVCPHCGSNDVNKFGFFSGKQGFRCKDCKRTFNEKGGILPYSVSGRWIALIILGSIPKIIIP